MIKSTLLITGGLGFVGSHLVKELSKTYNLIIIDKLKSKVIKEEGITIINKSILNLNFRDKKIVKKCDGIIHLAAMGRATETYKHVKQCFDSDLNSLIELIDIIKNNRLKPWFLIASSVEVDNEERKKNKRPYEIAKKAAEDTLECFSNFYNFKGIAVRFSDIYGSEKDSQKKIIPSLIKKFKYDKVVIIDNPSLKLNYIHVNDVVNNLCQLINKIKILKKNFSLIKFYGKRKMTLLHLSKLLKKISKSNSKIIIYQKKKRMKIFSAKKIFRFKIKKNFETSLLDLL